MKPILLEIVTKVITHFDHCRHCEVLFNQAGLDRRFHASELEEYPSDLKDEHLRLSEWIRELNALYKHRLQIRVINVQSFFGLYQSVRHRIRKYPTFIVEGKETYSGWDRSELERLLDKYIQASLLAHPRRRQPAPS